MLRLFGSLLVISTALAVLIVLTGATPDSNATASSGPFRCPGAPFYFPVKGTVGWLYRDPGATDVDGHLHTGIDVWASGGDGSPVYALADGYVSRTENSWSFDAVYTDENVESYITHVHHNLSVGDTLRAGEVIAMTDGEWVHISIGAFIGYDDRVLEQTQDPSPFFGAALNYAAGDRNPLPYNRPLSSFCVTDREPITPGDSLCDERKDSVDALVILQYTARLIRDVPCLASGDVNGDGAVDALDAALKLQHVAGLLASLPNR